MRLGDLLEWLAVLLLATAAYLAVGIALALVALALGLGYFAQQYDFPLARRARKPRLRKVSYLHEDEPGSVMFNCALCGKSTPHDEEHVCEVVA